MVTQEFYQTCQEIKKYDLLEAILDFFSCNDIPLGFTHTQLALNPKIQSPQSWENYRAISLCTNFQKILSKLLNTRLAQFLPRLISPNQSGSVQGRDILDNILLAQELAFAVDNKIRGSNVIIKLDMMKAYDRGVWSFLEKMLNYFGFSGTWISLIMRIATHCHYSLLLTGTYVGFIKSFKGLRQGDPLSPALFILMSEYLSKSLNALYVNNSHMYYCVPRGIAISHLSYADDCIVLCNGSI